VDKKEIFEVNTDKWIVLQKELNSQELWNLGIFQDYEFRKSLMEYINLSIEEALKSENILIRALAFIDRRVGKRKLYEIEISKNEHFLVKFMYSLRCEVEGILNHLN
jgi:hypothetical protein